MSLLLQNIHSFVNLTAMKVIDFLFKYSADEVLEHLLVQ